MRIAKESRPRSGSRRIQLDHLVQARCSSPGPDQPPCRRTDSPELLARGGERESQPGHRKLDRSLPLRVSFSFPDVKNGQMSKIWTGRRLTKHQGAGMIGQNLTTSGFWESSISAVAAGS